MICVYFIHIYISYEACHLLIKKISRKHVVSIMYPPKTNRNSWKKMFIEKKILFYKPSCFLISCSLSRVVVSFYYNIVHPCYEMLSLGFSFKKQVSARGLKIHLSQPPNHQTNQLQVATTLTHPANRELVSVGRWQVRSNEVLNCCQFTRCIYYPYVGQATGQLMRLKYLGMFRGSVFSNKRNVFVCCFSAFLRNTCEFSTCICPPL